MATPSIKDARDLEQIASELQRAGRYRDAEEPLRTAIGIWRSLRGEDDIDTLNDQISLAASFRRRGDPGLAIEVLEPVVVRLRAKAEADPEAPEYLRLSLNNLAMSYRDLDRLDDAREAIEDCLALVVAARGTNERPNVEHARALDNLSNILNLQGELAEAEIHARTSLAAWTEIRGQDDLDTAVAEANVGATLMRQGRYDEAAGFLERSLARVIAQLGESHPIVAAGLQMLGELEFRRGNARKAIDYLSDSLETSRAAGLPRNHPDVVKALSFLEILDPSATGVAASPERAGSLPGASGRSPCRDDRGSSTPDPDTSELWELFETYASTHTETSVKALWSAYLHREKTRPRADYDANRYDEVRDPYYNQAFGAQPVHVIVEPLPTPPFVVTAAVFGPRMSRQSTTLVTKGMSNERMPAASTTDAPFARAELVFYCSTRAARDPDVTNFLGWNLIRAAKYPFLADRFLGPGSLLPVEGFMDDQTISSLLVVPAPKRPERESSTQLFLDGDPVHLQLVIPIQSLEVEFVANRGVESFLERIEQSKYGWIFDGRRPSFV